jgi:hypothetical protein
MRYATTTEYPRQDVCRHSVSGKVLAAGEAAALAQSLRMEGYQTTGTGVLSDTGVGENDFINI